MAVPGLALQLDLLSPELEQELVTYLDGQVWSTKLSRRTQHYGYEYDYKSRKAPLAAAPFAGPILRIAEHLATHGLMRPTQCIVNEYTSDQGISAHTDAPIFGPMIVSISLLAPAEMIFTRPDQPTQRVVLLPRSLLIMTGESRSLWKHEIKGTRKFILPDGTPYVKPASYRRISLTFRTMA